MKNLLLKILILLAGILFNINALSQDTVRISDLGLKPDLPKGIEVTLEAGFLNPPESAKPRVWWHWMNGNITKEGIKADLLWMKRVSIRRFHWD